MSQQLAPLEIQGQEYLIEQDGDFSFIRPKKRIQCRIMATCKNQLACVRAHKEKVGILSSAPSKGEELDLEEEYSPSTEVFIANLPLVGTGEAKALCGQFYKRGCLERHDPMELPEGIDYQQGLDGQCLKDGIYLVVHRFYCHRPLCPVCTEEWRIRATSRALERYKVYDEDPRHPRAGREIHYVVSLPKRYYRLPDAKMRHLALSESKKTGFEGGSCIYHPCRKSKTKGMYFSPHFHMVGYGWIDEEKVVERNAKTGLIFKNIGLRESLGATISYELSHAGVPGKSGHVITWFGSMSYNKLHVEKTKPEKEKCPWGHVLQDVAYLGKEHLDIPKEEGFSCYLKSLGWMYLPKWKDPGGGEKKCQN